MRRGSRARGRVALLSFVPKLETAVADALERARLETIPFLSADGPYADLILIDARSSAAFSKAARVVEALKPVGRRTTLLALVCAADADAAPRETVRLRACADLALLGPEANRAVAARAQALLRFQCVARELGARLDEDGASAADVRRDLQRKRRARVLLAGEPGGGVLALMNALGGAGAETAAVFSPSQTARALSAFEPDCLVVRPAGGADPFSAVAALTRLDARTAIKPVVAYADARAVDAGAVAFDFDYAAPDADPRRAASVVAYSCKRAFTADAFARSLRATSDRWADPEGSGVLSADAFARRWRRLGRAGAGLGLIRAPGLSRFSAGRGANALAAHAAADLLKRSVRSYDAVGRLGPDLFAVALPGAPLRDAARTTERLAAYLRASAAPAGAPAGLFTGAVSAWTACEGIESPERALLRCVRQLAEG
ncbi:MAG: hypothetical protein AAFR11_14745 [Pseudomonadota bacterium]